MRSVPDLIKTSQHCRVTFVGVVIDVVGSQQCTVNVMQRVPRHCDVSSSDHVTHWLSNRYNSA